MQKMQSRYGNACITYHFYLQNKVIQKHEDYYLLETLFFMARKWRFQYLKTKVSIALHKYREMSER